MKELIKWREDQKSTYLYGSQLIWQKDSVFFNNCLMPSGQTIHAWTSRTNYQRDRMEPQLPLLLAGCSYRLTLVVDIEAGAVPYMQVIFYNREEKELECLTIKGGQQIFTYPENSFYYHIRLINAGCQSFVFHHLILETDKDLQ